MSDNETETASRLSIKLIEKLSWNFCLEIEIEIELLLLDFEIEKKKKFPLPETETEIDLLCRFRN